MKRDRDAEQARELYNRQFEEFSKQQTAYPVLQDLRRKIYAEYLNHIEGRTLLFAGCGDGRECLPAVEKGAEVVGIDVSEKGIAAAKVNCPKAEFFTMDMEATSFKDETFHIIISLFSVMYKENLVSVLSEFRRILKKDGFILLAVPHPVRKMMKYNRSNDYFLKGRQEETWKGIKRFGYHRLFEDYVEAFVASGLNLVQLSEPRPIKENESTPDAELRYPHHLLFKLKR